MWAGARGSLVDDLLKEARFSDYLGGRLVVVENASDAELDTLYRESLFTTYPSLSEGWGLPVGESLTRGKVCVASAATAIPEVGGDYAVYFDPEDSADAYRTLRSMIDDHARRSTLEQRIRAGFQPRPWDCAVDDIVAACDAPGHGPA